jgi:hypothetical protein
MEAAENSLIQAAIPKSIPQGLKPALILLR